MNLNVESKIMQILNPFKMNDWKIHNFLILIIAIQCAIWGAIGLDSIGLSIPILRQFIGFIYLFFVPGIIIIRILKIHKLNSIETLLLAVGSSISTIMFTGFFINRIYPMFGISKPISIIPLLTTVTVVVLILCVLCYLHDKEFVDPIYIYITYSPSLPALSLSIIPFISIFGAYIKNVYHSNILLMLLIGIIGLITILIGFGKFIPTKLYPFAIFVTSISLLFHTALISDFIWGWDIQVEYYLANAVIINSLWNPAYYSNANAMLSIVMLGPIFSLISNMSLIWVYKIAYTLLFSLVPLGLYQIYQKQTDAKIAFLSVFFFMFLPTYYIEMPFLARQEIAELFLVLVMLIMLDQNISKVTRSILLISFTFSLSVSHYGLSYIFMASIIIVWVLQYFSSKYNTKKVIPAFSTQFVALCLVFTLVWYMYISSSSTFITVVKIGDIIINNFMKDFLNPGAAQGFALIVRNASSPLHNIGKYLNLLSNFFITVGLLVSLSNRSKFKFEQSFVKFSIFYYILLLAAIAVPFFASQLNASRMYQISLFFLSPFCIIGGVQIVKVLNVTLFKKIWMYQHRSISYLIISIFLMFFLLFNSGWIYQLANDDPTSISLSKIDYPLFSEQEIIGKEWLYHFSIVRDNKGYIYADGYRWLLFLNRIQSADIRTLPADVNRIPRESYSYFSAYNLLNNEIILVNQTNVLADTKYISLNPYISVRNQIYSNGGSKIYYN